MVEQGTIRGICTLFINIIKLIPNIIKIMTEIKNCQIFSIKVNMVKQCHMVEQCRKSFQKIILDKRYFSV